jgi:hypothetical protein
MKWKKTEKKAAMEKKKNCGKKKKYKEKPLALAFSFGLY